MKTKIKQLKSKVRMVGAGALTVFLMGQSSITAYATGIQDSQIAKGTENLIKDATSWLMILAPVVAGLLIIYFCVRRSAADEMDQSAATRCCQ